MGSIENWLIEGVQEDDADIRGYTIQDLSRNWPPTNTVEMGLRIYQTYWRVSNQQWAGAPVLFMMVLVQDLMVLYLHSAGFWFWWYGSDCQSLML